MIDPPPVGAYRGNSVVGNSSVIRARLGTRHFIVRWHLCGVERQITPSVLGFRPEIFISCPNLMVAKSEGLVIDADEFETFTPAQGTFREVLNEAFCYPFPAA